MRTITRLALAASVIVAIALSAPYLLAQPSGKGPGQGEGRGQEFQRGQRGFQGQGQSSQRGGQGFGQRESGDARSDMIERMRSRGPEMQQTRQTEYNALKAEFAAETEALRAEMEAIVEVMLEAVPAEKRPEIIAKLTTKRDGIQERLEARKAELQSEREERYAGYRQSFGRRPPPTEGQEMGRGMGHGPEGGPPEFDGGPGPMGGQFGERFRKPGPWGLTGEPIHEDLGRRERPSTTPAEGSDKN